MITFGFRDKFSGWLRAITAIVIGLVMILNPSSSLELVVKVLAGFLIATGVVSLVYGIINRQRGALGLMISNAVVNVAFGAILFSYPTVVADIIIYAIGALLLVVGILHIIVLASATGFVGLGFLVFIFPVLCSVGGLTLLLMPRTSMNAIIILAGVALLVYGISEAIASWKMNRAIKAYRIRFDEAQNASHRPSGAPDSPDAGPGASRTQASGSNQTYTSTQNPGSTQTYTSGTSSAGPASDSIPGIKDVEYEKIEDKEE